MFPQGFAEIIAVTVCGVRMIPRLVRRIHRESIPTVFKVVSCDDQSGSLPAEAIVKNRTHRAPLSAVHSQDCAGASGLSQSGRSGVTRATGAILVVQSYMRIHIAGGEFV